MELRLRKVTPDNWREIKVEVRKEQKGSVASYITTLARAYVYQDSSSIVYAVYLGDTPVGVLMQRDYYDPDSGLICILDQFFIEGSFQGMGYGRAALELWLTGIKRQNRYRAVELCFVAQHSSLQVFYEKLGFRRKLEADDGDVLVMALPLVKEDEYESV